MPEMPGFLHQVLQSKLIIEKRESKMGINSAVFILAPLIGLTVLALFRAGLTFWKDEYPTFYSLVFGFLETLLFSFFLAGIYGTIRSKSFPVLGFFVTIFITAACLIQVELNVTNNKIIDSLLFSVCATTVFTFMTIGILYAVKHAFPWTAVFACSAVVIFITRIIVWLMGK